MSGSNISGSTKTALVTASIVAAVFVTIILFLGFSEQARYENVARDRATQYAEYAHNEARNRCLSVAIPDQAACRDKAVAETKLKSADNQRNEFDLVAQRTSALWTGIMGIAALVGVGLSGVGVYLVWTTFSATRESNVIALDTGKRSLRAYIVVRNVRVENLTPGQNPDVSYELTNVGQTPAYELRHQARIFFGVNVADMSATKVALGKVPYISRSTVGSGMASAGGFGLFETGTLSQDQYQNIMDGKHVIGFAIVASYRDIYKRRRLTVAKMFVRPERIKDGAALFTTCEQGNSAN